MSWVCNNCNSAFQLEQTLDFHLDVVYLIEKSIWKKFSVFSKAELGLEALSLINRFESCPQSRNMIHDIIQEINQSTGKKSKY